MKELITSLREHGENFPIQNNTCEKIITLIDTYGNSAFQNQNWNGHITASMLITNPEKTRVFLMFHKKLQNWLQFGGHSDGYTDALSTAIREFHEESGISMDPIVFPDIFDIDIHDIPADLKWRPAHQHYDILYLGIIPEDTPFARQEDEVDDIRWFDILWIEEYISEDRMLQMCRRIADTHLSKK